MGGPLSRRGLVAVPLTRLVGREQELVAITMLVREAHCRLVTIVGPGGVGTTRLATRFVADTAKDFPGGAIFVDPAPICDPDLVVPTIARAVGGHDAGSGEPQLELQRAFG